MLSVAATERRRTVRVLSQRVTELETQLRTVAQTFVDGLGNQVESLDGLITDFLGELERVPRVELEYLRRRRQVEVLTELYMFMQLAQKEAEITAAGESGGARVVDAAEVPIEPVVPQPLLTLIISLIVGVGIGVGGAAALEHAGSVVGEVPPEIAA
jgi:tyrosine-protein kinase Etk/Wzc